MTTHKHWTHREPSPAELEEHKRTAAVRTLERLGYTHRGGVEWAPPIGPPAISSAGMALAPAAPDTRQPPRRSPREREHEQRLADLAARQAFAKTHEVALANLRQQYAPPWPVSAPWATVDDGHVHSLGDPGHQHSNVHPPGVYDPGNSHQPTPIGA